MASTTKTTLWLNGDACYAHSFSMVTLLMDEYKVSEDEAQEALPFKEHRKDVRVPDEGYDLKCRAVDVVKITSKDPDCYVRFNAFYTIRIGCQPYVLPVCALRYDRIFVHSKTPIDIDYAYFKNEIRHAFYEVKFSIRIKDRVGTDLILSVMGGQCGIRASDDGRGSAIESDLDDDYVQLLLSKKIMSETS